LKVYNLCRPEVSFGDNKILPCGIEPARAACDIRQRAHG